MDSFPADNKRLDEWVTADRLNFEKLEWPAKRLTRDHCSASMFALSTTQDTSQTHSTEASCSSSDIGEPVCFFISRFHPSRFFP